MSYILKALKRTQVDPQEQAVARVATRSSRARAHRPRWPWLVASGLGVMALVVGAVLVITHQPELAVVALSPKADEHGAPMVTETLKSEPPVPPTPEPARPEATVPASAESVPAVPAAITEGKSSPTDVTPAHAQPGHHRPEPAETSNGETRATRAPAAAAPSRRPDAA
jgi:hypothetical protein